MVYKCSCFAGCCEDSNVYIERENEKKEWYDSRQTAKIFNKSISTINRWKHSGYLTARTIGGMDYYSKREIELKMGGVVYDD